jgi:UDP:flavonoid glycosyltransferase YjiC (YdhE family)
MVTVPPMPEQAVNSRRIVELGLGINLAGEQLTPHLLRDNVEKAAADQTIRENLARMANELHAGGGAKAGADALEKLSVASGQG